MQINQRDARFNPDFGRELLYAGYAGMLLDFPIVPAHFVAFLDDGTMAVTGSLISGGATYTVTFDVPASLISEFFRRAPGWLRRIIRAARRNNNGLRVVALPAPYQVGLRARLGKPVNGQLETFIPLIVSAVLPGPNRSEGASMCASTPLRLASETSPVRDPASAQSQLELNDAIVERFGVVLADPPWKYRHARLGRLSPDRHYPTLTTMQLTAMPVESLVARDSLLFLWATPPLLKEALSVLDAWGFEYTTNGVWDKESLGPGYHLRQQHELLLIGKRGYPGTPSPADRIRSVIRSRRGRHSAKPSDVHKYIERAYPDVSKIELFARAPRPGWAVWGNEVESGIRLPNPAASTFVQGMLAL